MKAIMVMFDSLNRHMLPNYGCDWIKAPNFKRLGDKCLTFDNFYAGSMPCMPARRELHTGRYNFLHRSWGPMEPFDVSMPELLKDNGVYTHLISDHYHYWEEGGATYHTKYNTFDIIRGQQGDPWIGKVADPDIPPCENPRQFNINNWKQDWKNRFKMQNEQSQPLSKCFEGGLEFINNNIDEDNWFLQIEAFDPHEPFYTMQKFKDLYPHDYSGDHFDWPNYGTVSESKAAVEHVRYEYAALVSMCDKYLGKVIDLMDENNMWNDTMLIVNTDHGFMLGEKEWWGKNIQPFYNEISHIPFFIWDPRCQNCGVRRDTLAQTIDIAPTLLDFFNVNIPTSMQGVPLTRTIKDNNPIRNAALFGIHGGHVNVTDGKYVYMRANTTNDNQPLYEYTLMPTHMRDRFSLDELKTVQLVDDNTFLFIDCPVLKTKATSFIMSKIYGTLLFDLQNDEYQQNPIENKDIEMRMIGYLKKLMKANEAPNEQFQRLGLVESPNVMVDELSMKENIDNKNKTLSIDSTLGEILADKNGKEVLQKYLKSAMKNPMLKMAKGLSVKQIASHSKGRLTGELLDKINRELGKISL